jgi:hypothetical protein
MSLSLVRGDTEVNTKSKQVTVTSEARSSLSLEASDSEDLRDTVRVEFPVTFCVCLPDATGLHVCVNGPSGVKPGESVDVCLIGPQGSSLRLTTLVLSSYNGAVRTSVRGGRTVDGLTTITPGAVASELRVTLIVDESLARGSRNVGQGVRKSISLSATVLDTDDDNDGIDPQNRDRKRSLKGMFDGEHEDEEGAVAVALLQYSEVTVTMSGKIGDGSVRRSLEPETDKSQDTARSVVNLEILILDPDDSVTIGAGGSSSTIKDDGPTASDNGNTTKKSNRAFVLGMSIGIVTAFLLSLSAMFMFVRRHHSRPLGATTPIPSSELNAKPIDDVFQDDEEDPSNTSFSENVETNNDEYMVAAGNDLLS